MKTVDIIGRLETAFYDLHIYIEGGEVYRYYGFQNAFVLITRLVKDGDDSAELMYRVGRCFKLAEYMNENAMRAFYIPRNDNPHANNGFLRDCQELKFVCSVMRSSMILSYKYYTEEIKEIENVLKLEELIPSYDLVMPPPQSGSFIPISDSEAISIKGGYKIAENRKTDFLKVFTAMIECHFFERADGSGIVSRLDFFKEVGQFLNTSLTYYNNLMSKAKFASEESYMKPFEEIADKAKERYDKV